MVRSTAIVGRYLFLLFFFFSSRRRHTRFDCDWSSDVCSSDLKRQRGTGVLYQPLSHRLGEPRRQRGPTAASLLFSDRKSTRLNSSHSQISYAVFCLKKKTGTKEIDSTTPYCAPPSISYVLAST